MIKERADRSVIRRQSRSKRSTLHAPREVVRLLDELTSRLKGIEAPREPRSDTPGLQVERWEDESTCYFEIALTEKFNGACLDISVIQGRAFLRISR